MKISELCEEVAKILILNGWRSPYDAQWEQLDVALPELAKLLAAAASTPATQPAQEPSSLATLHAECQRVAHNAIHDAIYKIDDCEPVKAAVRAALDSIDLAEFAAQPAPVAQQEPTDLMRAIYENRKLAFEFYQFAPDAVGPERDAARNALMASDAQLRAILAAAPVAAPATPATQPAQEPVGMQAAAAYIDAKADKYLQECAGTESDTGSTVFHYGDAGRDYHSSLVELAEELRAQPAPVAAQPAQDNRHPVAHLKRVVHDGRSEVVVMGYGQGPDFSAFQVNEIVPVYLSAQSAPVAAQPVAQEPTLIQALEKEGDWFDIHANSIDTYVEEGYALRKLYAAPVATQPAQEPTLTDRYVQSLHRAVEKLTAALHFATLRAHPHMTHAEIQAEIARIAAAPEQGERKPELWTVSHEDAGYYHSLKEAQQAAQDFDAELIAFVRA